MCAQANRLFHRSCQALKAKGLVHGLMSKLTKNQIDVLRLFHRGHIKKDIQKRTGLTLSSIDEALKRGRVNIDRAIETVGLAVENGWLSNSQIVRLRKILQKT